MFKQTCSYCDRSGILFYPVRYAIACPAGASGVPGLSGPFRVEGGPQDIGPAKYSLRAPRSGYLYVYDEKRRRLKAFVVLPTGFLSPIDEAYDPVQQVPDGSHACVFAIRSVVPTCFSIDHSDADPAGRVWCGWSNSFWTKRLRERVPDISWRKLHMKCFDVPSMLKGDVPHAREFSAAANSIPHFVANAKTLKAAFGFSATSTDVEGKRRLMRTRFEQLFAKSSSVGKAFVVALDDPVGIANDLSELTLPIAHAGFDAAAHRGSVCMNLLESLESGVRSDALRKAEVKHVTGPQPKVEMMVVRGGALPKPERHVFHRTEAEREKAIQAEVDVAWDELIVDGKPLLDKVRLKEFPSKYAAAMKEFESKATRLAILHSAWLQSAQLADWMEAVHDDEDIRSGYAYRESLAQCIGHGVNTAQCKEVLLAWLSAESIKDTKNLLGKALLFNQAALINATSPHLKYSDFPTEGILNLYKRAYEKVSKTEAAKLVESLILTIANVLIDAVRSTTSFVVRNLVMAGLSVTGHVVIWARHKTKRELWDWILEKVRNESLPLSQTRQQARAAAYDAAKTAARLRNESTLCILEIDMKSISQEGVIAADSVRQVLPGLDQGKKWLGSSSPREFRLGVVTSIVQLIALGFALNDLSENNRYNELETRVKAGGAAFGILMTVTEASATTAMKSTTHPLSLYLLEHWKITPTTLGRVAGSARVMGGLAGLVGAIFDLQKAWLAWQSDRLGASTTYVLSGMAGTILFVAAYAAVPALWIALIAAVAFALLLPYLNRADLQTWISRCFFGTENDRYLSSEEEVKSFNEAVGG
ncbi:T6SS effector BTH_I2691 family protein [Pseudoduganella violaceinigra]|uniref:T6SS effector BTH_I2691 family protein n=1 Tax=Pseudoduganella violaceinigra TaxID=246602 RepID=UPI0003F56B55|nr:T6SS effector BTH_I2691 family protein [Pseudoduganella violaceinigra]